jgi:hypothetical protein
MSLERESLAAAHWSRQQYESLFDTTGTQQRSERVAWVVEDERGEPDKVSSEAPEILAFLGVGVGEHRGL